MWKGTRSFPARSRYPILPTPLCVHQPRHSLNPVFDGFDHGFTTQTWWSLTPCSALFSSQEKGSRAKYSTVLIMAWSFWWPQLIQEPSWNPPKVALLEQKTLIPQSFQDHYVGNQSQRLNIRTKMLLVLLSPKNYNDFSSRAQSRGQRPISISHYLTYMNLPLSQFNKKLFLRGLHMCLYLYILAIHMISVVSLFI